jgi:LuxR family transcriptional regulator, maltose regulon positive regulatory protein
MAKVVSIKEGDGNRSFGIDVDVVGRVRPPNTMSKQILRADLLNLLNDNRQLPLILATAPPGFGKTTLMKQFFHSLSERRDTLCAWLTIDSASFGFFLQQSLISALRNKEIDSHLDSLDLVFDAVSGPVQSIQRSVTLLHNFGIRLTVFIDNFHLLEDNDIIDDINFLISSSGDVVTFIICSLYDSKVQIARLLLEGRALRLIGKDILFTPQEQESLFKNTPLSELSDVIFQYSGGWPIASQLFMMQRGKFRVEDGRVAGLSMDSQEIIKSLLSDVLKVVPLQHLSSLIRISILERFNRRICETIIPDLNTEEFFECLARLGPLMVSIDEGGTWFRFHHILTDYLQGRLSSLGQAEIYRLHLQAAKAFLTHAMLLESVDHALKAGDRDRGCEIVERSGGWKIALVKEIRYLANLLLLFDDEYVFQNRCLLLARTFVECKIGRVDEARRLLDRLSSLLGDETEVDGDFFIIDTILRGHEGKPCSEAWRQSVDRRLEALLPNDHGGRAALRSAAGDIDIGLGKFGSAETQERLALVDWQLAGSELGRAYSLLALGQSLYRRGRLAEASSVFDDAELAAARSQGSDKIAGRIALICRAAVAYWRDEHLISKSDIYNNLDSVEAMSSWIECYINFYFLAVHDFVFLTDDNHSFDVLRRMRVVAERLRSLELEIICDAWRATCLLRAGKIEIARQFIEKSNYVNSFNELSWRPQWSWGITLAHFYCLTRRHALAIKILKTLRNVCEQQERSLDLAILSLWDAYFYRERGEMAKFCYSMESLISYVAREKAVNVLRDFPLDGDQLLKLYLTKIESTRLDHRSTVVALITSLDSPTCNADIESLFRLSDIERNVVELVLKGNSNKDIAWKIGRSENTVKFHLKSIYKKFGVGGRSELLSQHVRR